MSYNRIRGHTFSIPLNEGLSNLEGRLLPYTIATVAVKKLKRPINFSDIIKKNAKEVYAMVEEYDKGAKTYERHCRIELNLTELDRRIVEFLKKTKTESRDEIFIEIGDKGDIAEYRLIKIYDFDSIANEFKGEIHRFDVRIFYELLMANSMPKGGLLLDIHVFNRFSRGYPYYNPNEESSREQVEENVSEKLRKITTSTGNVIEVREKSYLPPV